jgi:Fanconi-associated nuclease 1
MFTVSQAVFIPFAGSHETLLLVDFQQYLISRLVQRKRGKWHRFDHLLSSYVRDFVKYMNVPEPDVPKIMADSLLELCANLRNEKRIFVPPGQKDVIDLTLDSDDDEPTSAPNPNVPDTCAPAVPCPSDDSPDTALEIASFAEDTASATPAQLLECLTLDELKLVGKRLKVSGKTKQTRVELVKAILHSTSTQTTLLFAVVSKPLVTSPQKSKNDWRKLFPFKPPEAAGKRQNMHLQERRIREMCSEIYGACFRLRDEVFRVLHLVSVVYFRRYVNPLPLLQRHSCSYRSTEYSESDSIMLSAILATTGKRNYPKYEYKRTAEVFETRIDVLRYMETSQLLNQVENILEGVGQPPGVKFDRLKAAQDVISLWEAHWDRWNSLVAYLKDKSRRQRGLERFEEGGRGPVYCCANTKLVCRISPHSVGLQGCRFVWNIKTIRHGIETS